MTDSKLKDCIYHKLLNEGVKEVDADTFITECIEPILDTRPQDTESNSVQLAAVTQELTYQRNCNAENNRNRIAAVNKLHEVTQELEQLKQSSVVMPEVMSDYITHHDDFRAACVIAKYKATNDGNKAYWQHQINTLDNLRQALATNDKEKDSE